MELNNAFTVPVGVPQAWQTLLDVEQVAGCVPGATLESVDGDSFAGSVRVKLGPVALTYGGTARFVERDEVARRAVITASGKETKGAGTVRATITTSLEPDGENTKVVVSTALSVTGRPAQFGRGVMQDVSSRLLDQFATCLAHRLGAVRSAAPVQGNERPALTERGGSAAGVTPQLTPEPVETEHCEAAQPRQAEAISLVGVAWRPIAKRLVLPILLVTAIVLLITTIW